MHVRFQPPFRIGFRCRCLLNDRCQLCFGVCNLFPRSIGGTFVPARMRTPACCIDSKDESDRAPSLLQGVEVPRYKFAVGRGAAKEWSLHSYRFHNVRTRRQPVSRFCWLRLLRGGSNYFDRNTGCVRSTNSERAWHGFSRKICAEPIQGHILADERNLCLQGMHTLPLLCDSCLYKYIGPPGMNTSLHLTNDSQRCI